MSVSNPERALIATYAPPDRRAALLSLLALDDALGEIPRSTSEPALGLMRTVWWRDALAALDDKPAPAQPVLRALADQVLPQGIAGSRMADIAEGWAIIVEAETLGDAEMREYADRRGGTLFSCLARALGAQAAVADAGAGWALADLARNLSDRAVARRASDLAMPLLDKALAKRWPSRIRSLGAMAHLARMDLKTGWDRPVSTGSPGRVARLAWHRLSGR